jgi:hypothetical protein
MKGDIMFFQGSRDQTMQTYTATRGDGSAVTAVRLPLPSNIKPMGFHRRLVGQRLDHIANMYLTDATAFWKLCDANGSVVPDALAARDLIGVPPKG